MKWIKKYTAPVFEAMYNNDNLEDEWLIDFESIVEPHHFKERRRLRFIKELEEFFNRAGIQWRDTAQGRSRNLGTVILTLTDEEAARLVIKGAPLVTGDLSRNRATRLGKMSAEIERLEPLIDHTVPGKPQLTYWIQHASVKSSYLPWWNPKLGPKPTSSSFIRFEKGLEPREAIALFVNQVALDLLPGLQSMERNQ